MLCLIQWWVQTSFPNCIKRIIPCKDSQFG